MKSQWFQNFSWFFSPFKDTQTRLFSSSFDFQLVTNYVPTFGSRMEADGKRQFTRSVCSQMSLVFSVFLHYRIIKFLLRLGLMRVGSTSDTDLN